MKYYDDFQMDEVFVSRGRTITETDLINFCMFSGDWYYLHSDKEKAGESVFGERIAHGLLVLSATSGLMPVNEMAIVAFYGMDKVRFLAPTKIGDTLHLEVKVLEKKDKGDMGGVVTFESKVKNQKGEDAALSILKIFMAKEN